MKLKNVLSVKELFKYIVLILVFVCVETIFRIQPEMRSEYVLITDEVPILFDLLYATFFVTLLTLIPVKWGWLKKILYITVYSVLCIFMFSEYLYCNIFGRVYGMQTLQYANEGGAYIGMVLSYIDMHTILLLCLFVLLGYVGYFCIPESPLKIKLIFNTIFKSCICIVCIISIVSVPKLFMDIDEKGAFTYTFKKGVYNEWMDNKRAISMFGAYEYLARDIYLSLKPTEVTLEDIQAVSEYFENNESSSNSMTGIFEGKNLVMVLMESIDDCVVNERNMPTVYKMMQEGINFENMYTPIFGSASTLNAEFTSYTGITAPADGTPLVNYGYNRFEYSLPNLFNKKGYRSNVYHYNTNDFYNRKNMHHAVGFDEYICYLDYESENDAMKDDILLKNDQLYQRLTEDAPFFDYVITVSAHATHGKAYSYEDDAIQIYPEYKGMYNFEEMDSLAAKARLTDDMFKEMLVKFEEDGILDDTVIIGFTDHYVYTMLNQDGLKEYSNAGNEYELCKTPFFIWAEDIECCKVDKIVNSTDVYPTICNLFNLDNEGYYTGNDIFNADYEGYAYWPDKSWITSNGSFYANAGGLQGDMDSEKVMEMNRIIDRKIRINKLILDTNYFVSLTREN